MKFLKGLLIVIVILIAVVVIAGLIMPKDYNIERSLMIPTCSGVVFEQVADFRNWNNWSPWKERDSSITATYSESQLAVGAKWGWTGDPEMTGEGEMTCTSLTENEIGYHLHFLKPYESESDGTVKVEAMGDSTKVTWTMSGRNPFPTNVIMGLMGGLDAMIGPDFERGLALLSAKALETEIVKAESTEIQEQNFIGKRFSMSVDSITAAVYGATYGEIGAFMASQQISQAGAPIAIAHMFDEATRMMDIEIAIPISGTATPPAGLTFGTIPAGKALKHSYTGPYENLEPEWNKLSGYVQCSGAKTRYSPYEVYLTDPGNEPDPAKWQTDLIWPVE
jgi:effector-binding domain-containing protein